MLIKEDLGEFQGKEGALNTCRGQESFQTTSESGEKFSGKKRSCEPPADLWST
jgi:hypothetical protein